MATWLYGLAVAASMMASKGWTRLPRKKRRSPVCGVYIAFDSCLSKKKISCTLVLTEPFIAQEEQRPVVTCP